MIKKIALMITAIALGVLTMSAQISPVSAVQRANYNEQDMLNGGSNNSSNNSNNNGGGGSSNFGGSSNSDGSSDKPKTAILTECGGADKGNGEGIMCLLTFTVDILTIVVGTLAFIGITVCGIQYLTAGGNEEQVKKAKRRIFEIVIGLAAFLLINVILHWLLPSYDEGAVNGSTSSIITGIIG